jgi:PST family polysaccharide transporter
VDEARLHDADQPPGDLGDRAARGTGVTLAVQALRMVVQFGSVLALARLLVPEDFGLVAMVMAVIVFADLIRDFGLSTAAIQAPSLSSAERTNLFWANVAMGLGCTLLAMASTPLLVLVYDEPRLTPITLSLAWIFAISGFATQFRASLARDMRFGALATTDLAAQLVATAVALVLAAGGAGLWALVAQYLTNFTCLAVIFAWRSRWWPSWPKRHVSIRPFMRFGLGLFGAQTVGYATKNVDDIAIGTVWGATPLGLYNRAYQLMRQPMLQISAPMTNVVLPVLRHVQADDALFLRYLLKAQLVACYVTATVFFVACGLAEPLVLVLFGRAWEDVIPIFAALAIGGVFRAVAGVAWWAYLARGESGALFRQRLVTGGLSVALIIAGVPWGPVGVAVMNSLGGLLAWWIGVWHVGRVTGLDTRPLLTNATRSIAVVGLPAGALAYTATLVGAPSLVELVLGCALAVAYLGVTYAVVPFARADLKLTLSYARRALTRAKGRP